MVSLELFIDITDVDSPTKRNQHQEYFVGGNGGRCVGLTALPPSCADCLEIWDPQPPATRRVFPGLYRDCFNFTLIFYIVSVFFVTAVCLLQQCPWHTVIVQCVHLTLWVGNPKHKLLRRPIYVYMQNQVLICTAMYMSRDDCWIH